VEFRIAAAFPSGGDVLGAGVVHRLFVEVFLFRRIVDGFDRNR
jgi:hypothetical protein